MRPRTPTAILQLMGTYRQDRQGNRLDAATLPGTLNKPPDLSPDAAALWDAITATLPPGTLASIDAAGLTACCQWFARWRDLDRRLQAGDGDEYKLLTLAAVASKQFAALAGKFGLSPCDRAKLTAAPPPANPVECRRRYDTEPPSVERLKGKVPAEWIAVLSQHEPPPSAADVENDAG